MAAATEGITKTAARKLRQAKAAQERARSAAAIASQNAKRERSRNAALRVACSEYWADERRAGRTVHPNQPCLCEHCRSIDLEPSGRRRLVQRLWPGNAYVGSVGISFECHTEAGAAWMDWNAIAKAEREIVLEAVGFPTVIRGEEWVATSAAIDAGLQIQRTQKGRWKPQIPFVSGCQGPQDDGTLCGGLRPRGEKYCLQCRARAIRKMKTAGYL